MQTESALRDQVVKWLRTQERVWVVKVHGSMYGAAGTPDLLLCVAGRFVAIELKTLTGRLTTLQRATIEKIAAAGGVVGVARELSEVQEIVLDVLGREQGK